MKNILIKLRKSAGITQAELAEKLGMSRPTFIALEKGERDITLGELRKIENIFDIPLEIILDKDVSLEEKLEHQNTSQNALKKFHNLVLQCVKHGADDDGKITKTKLAKLVYLCDFANYYETLEPISGLEYRRLAQGPVAIQFFDMIDEDESIYAENKGKAIMISLLENPEKNVLSKKEEKIVQKVCKKWKPKNTKDIVEFTHRQIPWSVCRDGEVIPYELIHTEEPDNVY